MESFWQDVAYGARQLATQRGFTAVAVATLALGIGANIAIFNTLDAVLLKALPVERPEELVQVFSGQGSRPGERNTSFNNPLWEQLRDRQDVFAGIFAWSGTRFNLAAGGEVRYAYGLWTSGHYFTTLGLRPHLGRLLTPEDDRRGGTANLAVLSYSFWQREYGGDPAAIGREVRLDGHAFQIVGVAQPGFFGMDVGSQFDVAIPIAAEPILLGENSRLDRRNSWWMYAAGRLRPGVTLAQAEARLKVISRSAYEATLDPGADLGNYQEYLSRSFLAAPVGTGVSGLRERYERALYILMGIVALVLLIACANIANLLLARAAARQKEMGVRLALGASRARLIRQLVTESLLLAMAGVALAAPLGNAASHLLVRQISTSVTTTHLDLAPDWRVLAFAAGAALVTVLLFGVAPAFRATRVSLADAMKQAGPGVGDRRGRWGLGPALIVAQVAISMVLVAGAGLLLRTFHNLATLDAGFDARPVLTAWLDIRRATAPRESRAAFYDDMLGRVRALPGVTAAAMSHVTPISGSSSQTSITVEGYTAKSNDESVYFNRVTPQYFATLGTVLVAGRDFGPQDSLTAPLVAVVNETFARKYFPGRSPIGQTYSQGSSANRTVTEIVGLVRDAKYRTIRDDAPPTAFVPMAQEKEPRTSRNLVVRAAGSPAALTAAVRDAVGAMSPETTLRFRLLETQVADSLTHDRVLATLSGFFGALALGLSAVGLYGLLAHSVARRRREIGIRMALGSTPGGVMRLILGDGLRLAAAGVALGVAAALAATRVLAVFLYGVDARDPLTLAAVGGLLVAVAAAACSGAARRAARIEPVIALRHE